MTYRSSVGVICAVVSLAAVVDAARAEPFALVAGRRDKELIIVDLARALDARNSGTGAAVVARVPVGSLPSGLLTSPDGRIAYVVNHGGAADQDAINHGAHALFQHGHRGTVTIVDIRSALSNPTQAVIATTDSGGFGPVGAALAPDRRRLFVTNSEGDLAVSGPTPATEFGGHTIAILDHEQVLRNPRAAPIGSIDLGAAPDPVTKCLRNPNAIVLSRDGKLAFTADGGSNEISVVDVDARTVLHRVKVGDGPWAMALLPRGEVLVAANRERCPAGDKDPEGNSLSFVDLAKAAAKDAKAEVARVLVGTNDPAKPSRPFGLAASPDGRWVAVANFRTNNVSLVDVAKALADEAGAEVGRVALRRPDGQAARPRGVAFSPDGNYLVVSGGPIVRGGDKNVLPRTGTLWVIEVARALKSPANAVVSTVTEVGSEPYLVEVVR
jgi:YVTN family beta-propeller protein